jgi:hypothetical protein
MTTRRTILEREEKEPIMNNWKIVIIVNTKERRRTMTTRRTILEREEKEPIMKESMILFNF